MTNDKRPFAERAARSLAVRTGFDQRPSFRLFDLYTRGLTDLGWRASSLARHPVDRNGLAVPWIGSTMRILLEQRLPSGLRVFEWGAGSSTKWWLGRASQITSVEHDRAWYERVSQDLLRHQHLVLHQRDLDETYEGAIDLSSEQYDVIAIDGRRRVQCLRHAFDHLSNDGVIIFDNSERPRYRAGIEEMIADQGFSELQLTGIVPTGATIQATSLIYRSGDNILGI